MIISLLLTFVFPNSSQFQETVFMKICLWLVSSIFHLPLPTVMLLQAGYYQVSVQWLIIFIKYKENQKIHLCGHNTLLLEIIFRKGLSCKGILPLHKFFKNSHICSSPALPKSPSVALCWKQEQNGRRGRGRQSKTDWEADKSLNLPHGDSS